MRFQLSRAALGHGAPGKAHLHWQPSVWASNAQPSEPDASEGATTTTKKIQLGNTERFCNQATSPTSLRLFACTVHQRCCTVKYANAGTKQFYLFYFMPLSEVLHESHVNCKEWWMLTHFDLFLFFQHDGSWAH